MEVIILTEHTNFERIEQLLIFIDMVEDDTFLNSINGYNELTLAQT